ncbi:hypothetical protein NP511_14120 [Natrinema thermotolerans]|uniref:Uncharacterized protein n=1 Tax=Natrinema thermotolerans TaxID=121872 RepID=A0AAF0P8M6_9EURY|nr:hypothetical protein [Natrinema thermotolerans]QCC59546.1 hypothetical protein DVR14_13265 [Natrinema thermotolerans]WMT06520.1 hypothetical protein NP511_14120 [Natrinema thermotolerans]
MLETFDLDHELALVTALSTSFRSYGASSVMKPIGRWRLRMITGHVISSRLAGGRRGQHISVVIDGMSSIVIPIVTESCISV